MSRNISRYMHLRVNTSMNKKEKIEVFIDTEIKEKLKIHAENIGGTMAGIIKVALKDYLKKHEIDR